MYKQRVCKQREELLLDLGPGLWASTRFTATGFGYATFGILPGTLDRLAGSEEVAKQIIHHFRVELARLLSESHFRRLVVVTLAPMPTRHLLLLGLSKVVPPVGRCAPVLHRTFDIVDKVGLGAAFEKVLSKPLTGGESNVGPFPQDSVRIRSHEAMNRSILKSNAPE